MISYGGLRWLRTGWREEYLITDGPKVIGLSDFPKGRIVDAVLLPPLMNPHIHSADSFLRDRFLSMDIDLAEAVGPGGFKHRELEMAGPLAMVNSIKSMLEEASSLGVQTLVDFREGGATGLKTLDTALEEFRGPLDHIALGRPTVGDIDEVLSGSAGLGLSSISDAPYTSMTRWADKAHRTGKILALHASEGEREDMDKVLALKPDILIHCTSCDKYDARQIARSGIPVVICPRSNASFGMIPNIDTLTDNGVTVLLGTDNGMVCDPSPLNELRFLVQELDIGLERAMPFIDSAKVLNPLFGIGPDPEGMTMIAGSEAEDLLHGEVIAVARKGVLSFIEGDVE